MQATLLRLPDNVREREGTLTLESFSSRAQTTLIYRYNTSSGKSIAIHALRANGIRADLSEPILLYKDDFRNDTGRPFLCLKEGSDPWPEGLSDAADIQTFFASLRQASLRKLHISLLWEFMQHTAVANMMVDLNKEPRREEHLEQARQLVSSFQPPMGQAKVDARCCCCCRRSRRPSMPRAPSSLAPSSMSWPANSGCCAWTAWSCNPTPCPPPSSEPPLAKSSTRQYRRTWTLTR